MPQVSLPGALTLPVIGPATPTSRRIEPVRWAFGARPGGPSESFIFLLERNPLAEQVHSREIHDFITVSTEHGLEHENAKALDLLIADRWRHRKLLARHLNLD